MTQALLLRAEAKIALIATAAEALNDAVSAEDEAIRARDEQRDASVAALLGNPNPLTNKPHSLASATEAAEKDATYRLLDDMRRLRARQVTTAQAALDEAKLRARLAVIAADGAS